FWCDDEHIAWICLLTPLDRIEIDKPDVAALHQMISLPTGSRFIHIRSSSVISALGSHCARSSSRVYFGRFRGTPTSFPSSIVRSSLAFAATPSVSSNAFGIAIITEPPTVLKVDVVTMSSPEKFY